ncbi:MAG: hypothetical protein QOG03_1851 [Actinomycetota bacterium]|nr:hypothetical protein [Actinomycetota bacterium]
MKKVLALLGGAALVASMVLGSFGARADTVPGGAEGCIIGGADVSGGGVTASHAADCTYTATRGGGYAGAGSGWTVTVNSTVYTAANGHCQTSVIKAGDTVAVHLNAGAAGRIAAGNPFPSAADAAPSSGNSACPA